VHVQPSKHCGWQQQIIKKQGREDKENAGEGNRRSKGNRMNTGK
jgi:hypothetical protein